MVSLVEPRLDAERQITAIVNGLYESLLDRQADANGLEVYGHSLRTLDVEQGLQHIVKAIISSPEFEKKTQHRLSSLSANKESTNETQITAIVNGLYDNFLGRPPDAEGLKFYEDSMRTQGIERGLLDIVKALILSPEFERNFHYRLSLLGNSRGRTVNDKKISLTVSLGTHCLSSYFLKKYALKSYSLPFDWCISAPRMIVDCLDDDFATFLDPKYYQSLTESRASREHRAQHTLYLERYNVDDVFAHRDPTKPEDKAYYDRAVARFRNVLKSDDAKLFLMITKPTFDVCDSFDTLSKQIRSKTSNSAFICVQLQTPTYEFGCHSMSLVKKVGDHALYRFQPSSYEDGVGFEDPIDDQAIMRLVNQFSLDIKSELK